jgi:hypothetical protein
MTTSYQPRPAEQVTTEDLVVTIRNDRNDVATFEARAEFGRRCGDWRKWAPIEPRTFVTDRDGGRIEWHNFHETGLL